MYASYSQSTNTQTRKHTNTMGGSFSKQPVEAQPARRSHDSIREELATLGIYPEDDKNTFHDACKEGNSAVVRLMIDLFREYNSDKIVFDGFCYASANGHVDVVQVFLSSFYVYSMRQSIYSAISHAAANGHVNVVRLLHNFYESESTRADYASVALLSATENDQLQVIEFLLTLDLKESKANEALKIAAGRGCLEVVKCLVLCKHVTWMGHLIACTSAAKEGHLPILQCLCDLTNVSKYLNTGNALKVAVERGDTKMVEFIVNLPDLTSVSLKHIDINHQSPEIADLLKRLSSPKANYCQVQIHVE